MGNELGKLVAKHEAHIPVLNEDLAIPYALPTGGVFIPMSPITGDLPIYSIPQIILNAGMDGKDYQDCIYEINETSISRYSNLRCVIERLKYDLAPFDLYYQRIDVEDKCFELNNKILKKYNLVFLPFMDILRDDNNTQHFGIIIDMLNRNKIEKKMTKIRKQNIRKIRKNNNNNKKNTRNNNNNNNNKSSNKTEKEGKIEESGIVKPSLFGCFKFLSHTNSKSSQKVISKLSRTNGISSESSDCTENDNNDKNDTNDKIDANNNNNNNNNSNNNNNNNNNNNDNNNDGNEMTPSGVSMALPSPCSSPDSETKYMNNKSNGNNEIVICECKEDVDDSGTIEIENKMSYVGSNATKFGLHIYLPKHLRCDA